MKILHVIATMAPRDGGPSKACFEMARATARLGHEVTVMTTNMDGAGILDIPFDRPVLREGVTLRFFPIQQPRFWGTSLPMAKALKAAIPGMDIVHIHSLYMFHDLVAGFYCRRFDVPYLLRPHGTLDPYIYRRHRLRKSVMEIAFQNTMLRRAAALHYTAEEERKLAEPYTRGVPAIVLPNGLDFEEYEKLPPRGAFRARHPEIGAGPIVLFLGRINFKKGFDILIPAFRELSGVRPDARLVIAGPDGGLRRSVEKWVSDSDIGARVFFVGMLEGDDKRAVFADADIFVLPSHSENFGIAVIEAMASGVPVLISDKVNIWREVEAAGAGRVMPTDIEACTTAMAQMLAAPDLRARIGAAGRALVREQYDWAAIAEELVTRYRDILGQPTGKSAAEPTTGISY